MHHHKPLNRRQFGQYAQNFVTSAMHAKGYSLRRLVELTQPQPDWRVLDVATGGGHTALMFAQHVNAVIASDLTHQMLATARRHITPKAGNVVFSQADAETLPFAAGTFDCVTCRIAPHHFPDVGGFVREAARVLVQGGVLAVADNIVSGEPTAAKHANLIDLFRDPSHHWSYSLDDWETFFFAAGLRVAHRESFQKETDFDEWAERIGVRGNDLTRLRAMLIQAPAGAREWFAPRQIGSRLVFSVTEAIVVGYKD